MLRLTASADKDVLRTLSEQIFHHQYNKGVGYVLYDEETPIGLAELVVTPQCSFIEGIGIVPSARGKGNGDFLTRSILFALGECSEKTVVRYVSPYFEKFGFREEDGCMVRSGKPTFPRCGR